MHTLTSFWVAVRRSGGGAIASNTASLAATTGVSSLLGFAYWSLAAHLFSAEALGLASAAISAMLLVGNVGMLGFGTVLIGELPRRPGEEYPLIATALAVVGTTAAALGILLAVLVSQLSPDLQRIVEDIGGVLLFALGVSLTSIALVLDQAVIGLLRGHIQLARNTLFSAVKLVAVVPGGLYLSNRGGATIFGTWILGNLVSLAVVLGLAVLVFRKGRAFRPQWGTVRELRGSALRHHALNLALQAPSLVLPLVVTSQLSATMNGYFYAAWMFAGFVFVVPVALSTVLYAAGAADPPALPSKLRFTLGLAAGAGLLACIVLVVGGDVVLGIFGKEYALQASSALRILVLGVFPLIIKDHYVTVSRVQDRAAAAIFPMLAGALLELIVAGLGASIGGLPGLSMGWVLALCVEAAYVGPDVYKVAVTRGVGSAPTRLAAYDRASRTDTSVDSLRRGRNERWD